MKMADHQRKPVVFISYRASDTELATALADAIFSDFIGIAEVFLAERMPIGKLWKTEIKNKLNAALVVIVLRSEQSETRWIAMEIGAAWAVNVKIIPVCYGKLKKKT